MRLINSHRFVHLQVAKLYSQGASSIEIERILSNINQVQDIIECILF